MRALAGLLTFLVTACATSSPPRPTAGRGAFVLPDHRLTPGAVATHSLMVICHTPTSGRRQVSDATKAQVYARYGLPVQHGAWEIDHLIPLELGGSNAVANLWPEPGAIPNPKDRLENTLHRLVCAGKVNLTIAQAELAKNWVVAYKEFQP